MRTLTFVLVTAALVVNPGLMHTAANGQTGATSGKTATSWTCSAANPVHALPVGDTPDHMYVVEQSKCTATKGEIAGVAEKEGTATEFADVVGDTVTGHGIFVETLANGDKLHVTYTFKGTSKNKVLQSGSNKWSVASATGMFKGVKASGTCTAKGNPDGTANFECNGAYTLAK